MIVRNSGRLIARATSPRNREARRLIIQAIEAALTSVDPIRVMKNRVGLKGNVLCVEGLRLDLRRFRRVIVIGAGKATAGMASGLEEVMGRKITIGLVNTPRGAQVKSKTKKIAFHEAGHPLPDYNGVQGTREMLRLIANVDENDLVICLFSGGGSAMMPLPADGISLADKRKVTAALLKAGASISEINVVRKHISRCKGGRLAELLYPAQVLTLVFSDVVDDRLDVIASGPTVPDISTFHESIDVLKKYEIWPDVPQNVRSVLLDGANGKRRETPKPGDRVFHRVHNFILCNNRAACNAAVEQFRKSGLNSLLLTAYLEGEAREAGRLLSSMIKEVEFFGGLLSKPAAVVLGGETTVRVSGVGRGGPNQELALCACMTIQELDGVAVGSVGTDGIDGPTDAAGALVDGATVSRARRFGLDPSHFLRKNDSYSFFSRLGDLVFTGSTGTNVNDLSFAVVL